MLEVVYNTTIMTESKWYVDRSLVPSLELVYTNYRKAEYTQSQNPSTIHSFNQWLWNYKIEAFDILKMTINKLVKIKK